MSKRILFCALVLCWVPSAQGESVFSLRYDARFQYPESLGWQRHHSSGVTRTLGSGVLRVSADDAFDFYTIQSDAFSLADGESLVVRWRMRTLEGGKTGPGQVTLAIHNESAESAWFTLSEGFVADTALMTGPIFVETGVFHEYEFRTDDMSDYTLMVDGELAIDGTFSPSPGTPDSNSVSWGDSFIGSGAQSIAEWDFVEVTVVPEPGAAMVLLVAGGIGLMSRRRR